MHFSFLIGQIQVSEGAIVEFEEIPCSFRLRKPFKQWKLLLFVCVLTPTFFWNLFFLTFHQQGVIWEKSVKGNLSVLLSFATGVFFPRNGKITFPTFCDFLSVFEVFKAYKLCKELLLIRPEMIWTTQIYFTSKNASRPWTSWSNNASFPIYSPPPCL